MAEKEYSFWKAFKNNFPAMDVIIGFIIPKAIFFIGLINGAPFLGGVIGLAWCLVIFLINYMRGRKINVFAVLAVIMIVVRIAIFTTKNNPRLYLFVQAVDNIIYAAIFLGSLFFKRSLIQFFAESSGAKFSERIRRTPYYARAWKIVTSAWGVTYVLTAFILILLKLNSMQAVGLIDLLSGWPVSTVLFIFSIQFPKWYWRKNYAKIEAYK